MTDSTTRQREGLSHLQQIIAGLTEGVVIIHPDGEIAWANATALALHGVTDRAELGATVAEYRGRYELRYMDGTLLRADDYPMARLLAGETFREIVVRCTPRETPRCTPRETPRCTPRKIPRRKPRGEHRQKGETRHWVHQLRTMVLAGPGDDPDRLVLILNDETERFNAEQRFERAFAANPAPAIIARLADMRYVKVNHGFMELTGWTREALIGHSMHEIDVLLHAEKRDLAVARLHAGATIPQMESALPLPDGREHAVLLGGQPIEIGDEPCMLFTFADLHPRKQAEDALRQSEERFAKAFHMAPGPMAILALDGLRVLDVNAAFTAATGWRREEVVGRTEAEIGLWGQQATRERLEHEVRQTGHLRSVDIELRGKDGASGDYLLSADTVTIQGARCVLSVMLDITERKRTETELVTAIHAVMQDTSWFGQKVAEKLANLAGARLPGARAPELASLPERARQVLGLLAAGLGDEDIARRLGISRNTVRNHVAVIYRRIGLRKRAAVIVWARERGLGMPASSKRAPGKSRRRKPAQTKGPAG